MSELMDAVKLLEDAVNERANLDTLIERLENELFRLVQRRRDESKGFYTITAITPAPTKKIGRPKGSKNKMPRAKAVRPDRLDQLAKARAKITLKQRREWGKKGAIARAANRAAKQNGNAVAAE